MRFINNSWQIVGYRDISHGMARNLNLVIAPDGTPYIAFGDYNIGFYHASVMRFNGSGWEYVGQAGFSNGEAIDVKLAINSKGVLYVAYIDYDNQSSVIAKQFNSLVWVTLGEADISDRYANDISLAINKNDIPYIAYVTFSPVKFQTKVKLFNGCAWELLGITNFTNKEVYGVDLKISNDGIPYIVFYTQSMQLILSTYLDNEWKEIGTNFLTYSGDPKLVIYDNTPYIAFRDYNYQYKLTVINFINNKWDIVGDEGFTAIYADNFDFAISPDGTPYAVYDDYNSLNYAVSVMGYL
jgi:hypothetical protein